MKDILLIDSHKYLKMLVFQNNKNIDKLQVNLQN